MPGDRGSPRERRVWPISVLDQLGQQLVGALPPVPDDRHRPLSNSLRAPANAELAEIRRRTDVAAAAECQAPPRDACPQCGSWLRQPAIESPPGCSPNTWSECDSHPGIGSDLESG